MKNVQNKFSEWYQHRKGVITASACYRVYTRVHTLRTMYGPHNELPLLQQICGKAPVVTPAMQEGTEMEPNARDAYMRVRRSHGGCEIGELELVLHESYPFNGCSSDRLLRCECGAKLLKLNSPRAWKHLRKRTLSVVARWSAQACTLHTFRCKWAHANLTAATCLFMTVLQQLWLSQCLLTKCIIMSSLKDASSFLGIMLLRTCSVR